MNALRIDKSVVATLILLLVGLAAFAASIYSSISLYYAIHRHAQHVALQLGAFYLVGSGVILIGMTLFALYMIFIVTIPGKGAVKTKLRRDKNKPLSKKDKIMQWAVGIFFLLVLISIPVLPQVMKITVGEYLETHGYTYCDNLSSQWFFDRTMVFRRDTCHPIGKQNELFN